MSDLPGHGGRCMTAPMRHVTLSLLLPLVLAACAPDARLAGFTGQPPEQGADAPDPLIVAQNLADAGEHELALRAYLRAALDQGMTGDVLTGMGASNLALARLGQAEDQLRRATDVDPMNVAAWNNLGVLLIERGQPGPARGVFEHALALPGGDRAAIRTNLELALARSRNSATLTPEAGDFVLIRQGGGTYRLSPAQDGSRN